MAGPVSLERRGLDVLRILIGVVWAANLLFIFLPAADYWGTFGNVAAGFGSSSLFGSGFASYVADHALLFSWIIALVTGYLAFAFLFGFTTRLACAVGFAASVAFLITQWETTFAFPGGTDVGPHPLYLLIYFALFVGGAGRYWSLDSWVWRRGRVRFARLARWISTPDAMD